MKSTFTHFRRRFSDLLLAILALLPFYSVYAAHALTLDEVSGFIQYDMPYYVANGREIFERGNGFAAPNPYDFATDAPVIYFHWLTWIIGFSVSVLKFDPGVVFVGIGILAGVLGSYLTLQIVRQLVGSHRSAVPIFLLSMWGGGCFFAASLLTNLIFGEDLLKDLLAYDPGGGWWFLTWGRNFLLPTEATYHALVAGIWLAIVKRREWLSVLLVTLLASTHPFSGIQHLLILGSWNLVQLLFQLQRQSAKVSGANVPEVEEEQSSSNNWQGPLQRGLVITAVLAVFLSYYFVFLEQFPAHSELRETWSLRWSVSFETVLLAYGVVFCIALKRLAAEGWKFEPTKSFFLVAFGVSFLLIQHDLFVKPHQPLHFTRGYVWMPLFLLGTPLMASWFDQIRARSSQLVAMAQVAIVIFLASLDNLAFLTTTTIHNRNNMPLPAAARDAFKWMNDRHLTGVLLTSDAHLAYLSATFTSVRPYYGHKFNTPQYAKRVQQVEEWQTGDEAQAWLNSVDYLLLPVDSPLIDHLDQQWTRVYRNDQFVVFQK